MFWGILSIVEPIQEVEAQRKERPMMTEDGIVYNEDNLYCPECGDIYAPTVDYCDVTLRCTGVDLLPVDRMFA